MGDKEETPRTVRALVLQHMPFKEVDEDYALQFIQRNTVQSHYLALLVSNFQADEAANLLNIEPRVLEAWRRQDPVFREIEELWIPQLREKGIPKALYQDFVRNFHSILLYDGRILKKAMQKPQELTDKDETHIKVIRRHYTAEQFERMKAIAEGKIQATKSLTLAQIIQNVFMDGKKDAGEE